ncbi:unnamed protein product [Meloidogyne enterolobii]|uniref:Uncharacterized protein n=1 Tax=Meloidogyne enterolobii TaxID=390850 RepID=A0ACB0YM46_MELEN
MNLLKLSNLSYNKCVNFVKTKNKWNEIFLSCCENKCINTDNPVGNCIKGNGFGNIINDENIKYINCLEWRGGRDKYVRVYTENAFKKPLYCFYQCWVWLRELAPEPGSGAGSGGAGAGAKILETPEPEPRFSNSPRLRLYTPKDGLEKKK